VAGTAEAALGTQAESLTREWYHVARTLRTLGGTRVDKCFARNAWEMGVTIQGPCNQEKSSANDNGLG
jgi:hypothetical protein